LTITAVTKAATGQLASRQRRHDVLLDVGAYAELADPTQGRATVQFRPPVADWKDGKLTLSLGATVNAAAPIKVHIDTPIGGGIGTSVGIIGAGSGQVSVTGGPAIMSAKGMQMAVLDARMSCEALHADLRTDGVFKTDFGWTRVPSIGGHFEVPLGREPITPTLLLDQRPRFVRFPITESSGNASWRIRPKALGAVITIEPQAARGDAAGFFFAANLTIAAVAAPEDPAMWKTVADDAERATGAAAKKFEDAATAALKEVTYDPGCQIKPRFALLLGELEFGENNEIVKFLVALGKLPHEAVEAVEKMGHEVSTEKIQEWMRDPAGSFARSDPGKAVEKLQHETSPEKQKEWVEHPVDSLQRGSLNPGNWFKK
jgi:hypothetical protein